MKLADKTNLGSKSAAFAAVASACFAMFAGSASAVVNWAPNLASGSTANAEGKGFVAPTIGATSNATSTSLQVNWAAPTTGATPNHYSVSRCTGSGCSNFAPVASGTCSGSKTGSSCVDTGLSPGTTYQYEVSSVLGSNWVSTSGTVAGTTKGSALVITGVAPSSNKATFSGTGGANSATVTVYVCTTSNGCPTSGTNSATGTVSSGSWTTGATSSNVNDSTAYYAQAYQTSPSDSTVTSGVFGPFHCVGTGVNETCSTP